MSVKMVSTTSLIVAPNAFLTALISESGISAQANFCGPRQIMLKGSGCVALPSSGMYRAHWSGGGMAPLPANLFWSCGGFGSVLGGERMFHHRGDFALCD